VLLDKRPLEGDSLHYLGLNRDELHLTGSTDSRVLLLGGEPFKDPLVMWWNFVGGSHEEMAEAREDWIHHRRFGEVKVYRGDRLPAPDLMRRARET
jgi:redox-sensitive bicupin YhaK (pirin superfamily)